VCLSGSKIDKSGEREEKEEENKKESRKEKDRQTETDGYKEDEKDI
jgi:hypothetical protein